MKRGMPVQPACLHHGRFNHGSRSLAQTGLRVEGLCTLLSAAGAAGACQQTGQGSVEVGEEEETYLLNSMCACACALT